MSDVLAYPLALAAALPTTLLVLAVWVLHARVVDGYRVDSVFLPLIFLFVPLVFIVSAVSNAAAVAIGQLAGLAAPALRTSATVAAAGVLTWCGCAWTQRGLGGWRQGAAPVSAIPVALFGLIDMLILAGSLRLLPDHLTN